MRIDMTETEADTVRRALHLYEYLLRGDFTVLLQHLPDRRASAGAAAPTVREVACAREQVQVVRNLLYPELRGASEPRFDLSHEEVPTGARIARKLRDRVEFSLGPTDAAEHKRQK